MVKKLLRFFAYFFFFVLALIYFAPKESIYYYLEQELKPLSVIISGETLEDKGLGLNIQNANIYVKSIESAKVAHSDITLLLFYNSIQANDIALSQSVKSFLPLMIESVSLTHNILTPQIIMMKSKGEFGEAKGVINILERRVLIEVEPSELMTREYQNALSMLRKNEEGVLVYDQAF